MSDTVDLARQTQAVALARGKRWASMDLYRVLAPCMELCERAERDKSEEEKLRALVADQPAHGRNRVYVEANSDIYTCVCRFIFSDPKRRTESFRYAAALREAAKRQVGSGDLVSYLSKNGGVSALYFARPLAVSSVKTKTLHLTEPTHVHRDREFTLTLRWQTDNSFKVLENIPNV